MEKPTNIDVHIDSFLRLTELLGDNVDIKNAIITLPHSDELDRAVLTINKLCSEELYRQKKRELDMFCAEQYGKLIREYENGKNTEEIKRIMRETASYYKDKK